MRLVENPNNAGMDLDEPEPEENEEEWNQEDDATTYYARDSYIEDHYYAGRSPPLALPPPPSPRPCPSEYADERYEYANFWVESRSYAGTKFSAPMPKPALRIGSDLAPPPAKRVKLGHNTLFPPENLDLDPKSTVGDNVEGLSRCPLCISLKDKGKILDVLKNWSESNIQVIVVTGLGDVRCQGSPITIDVGTNNEQLLNDEVQKRATDQEYHDLFHEFMTAVKQKYGNSVLIQGTASFVLAGVLSALKLLSDSLGNQTFLFVGAGEAGTGIAELIALEMSTQAKLPIKEARKKFWFVDSQGLIALSRKISPQHFKKPRAHKPKPVNGLLHPIKGVKPTFLVGLFGVGKQFTKDVVEAMALFNKRPVIMALWNPMSQAECTAEEAYTWSEGRAIFTSGSPFDPFEYKGNVFIPGQANNAYIFPGFGLGLVISGAIRVYDDMLLVASEALAAQVTEEHLSKGMTYPPLFQMRKISANIAATVAAKAYDLGVATHFPRPQNLVEYAETYMYSKDHWA
ncbi:hypothetical protein Tsubulata_000433 [Turnera subulata]|uniref:Malic enzyme NAD-binding domain-containing protein n=1 Tax=Turnera subulata TaxID=218843 RepID=A0A9Q0G1Z3_9ROSI|nr:hypothetical protein Tsubulata_000433 [Turnera subulata]